MRLLALLAIAPFALATFGGGDHRGNRGHKRCPTQTILAESVTTLYTNTVTQTATVAAPCKTTADAYMTVNVDSWITLTKTQPGVTVTVKPATVVKTKTKTTTITTCVPGAGNGHHKRAAQPKAEAVADNMTNAERLRRHLPLKKPSMTRRSPHFYNDHDDDHHNDDDDHNGNQGPSCLPATVRSTKIKSVNACATTTVTKEICSSTEYNIKTITKTKNNEKTAWVTVPAPSPVTVTSNCATPTQWEVVWNTATANRC